MPSISENILLFISGFGILQGLLLATLIYFHPRSDKSVNSFLALHIFFISKAMTMPFAIRLITWQRANLMQPLLVLSAIFLYLYLRSFKERITFKKIWPHFLIFLSFVILVVWNTFSIISKYPNASTPPKEVFYQPFNLVIPILRICIKLVYYFLARQTVISYQKSIQQLFSDTSRINLNWARVLVNGYLFIVVSGIVIFVLMLNYPQYFNLLLLINVAIGTPYIYLATYKGITQPTLWQIQPEAAKDKVEKEMEEVAEIDHRIPDEGRSVKWKIAEDRLDEITQKLVELMEREKIYQEPELTLQQLSDKLQFPYYQVSQAINEGMKKNFYDLVNSYRIEEAKRLLLDPRNLNYTVLSVGFEAGFNSKTTFNTVFKKFTGLTPTEFRDKQTEPFVSV